MVQLYHVSFKDWNPIGKPRKSEFITSQSSAGVSSAKNYPSGSFLSGRYVKSAKIIGHANIE